ncbi:MAG: YihY/virulence factor BrkB family protein [Cyanobacteria bacterium J06623_5]
MTFSSFWSVLKQTFEEWQRDKVSRLAAALAYYTTFSLAPILVIVIAVASSLFDQAMVQARIIEQMQGLLGENAAELVREMLANRSQNSGELWPTLIGIGLLIVGASGLFIQLQDALNTVWNVVPKKGGGLWNLIRNRLLSFGMVLVIGFLLLVSLMLSAGISAIGSVFGGFLVNWEVGLQLLNALISFGVVTLLFALIYKILPDVTIAWSDVWVGSAITSLLFTIGKFLIGLYLGNSGVASAYGAAGSFVVLLLWIYYSAQILLFGAEFTQVYANRFGSQIRPDSHAKFAADASLSDPSDRGKDRGKDRGTGLPRTRSEYRAMSERL